VDRRGINNARRADSSPTEDARPSLAWGFEPGRPRSTHLGPFADAPFTKPLTEHIDSHHRVCLVNSTMTVRAEYRQVIQRRLGSLRQFTERLTMVHLADITRDEPRIYVPRHEPT